jgi:hypothetical protein
VSLEKTGQALTLVLTDFSRLLNDLTGKLLWWLFSYPSRWPLSFARTTLEGSAAAAHACASLSAVAD